MPLQYKTVGLSVPFSDLHNLELAKAKAKRERRSFSNYVCGLIAEDLRANPVFDSQAKIFVPDKISSKVHVAADKIEAESRTKISGSSRKPHTSK